MEHLRTMPANISDYLQNGCMRCHLGASPACKVNFWRNELMLLRNLVLACGLTEEIKWGVPCYTVENKNVLMVSAFKDYACLSFFKGVLLEDAEKILLKPGDSSQSSRIVKFTNPELLSEMENTLKSYILEAIAIEKAGKKVVFDKNPEPIPDELEQLFLTDTQLRDAFYALTPGKQRGYIIYFSQPKSALSRIKRIEKYEAQIKAGIGLNDKYNKKNTL
jgi:uncharacterized protein YdeI (YjbR/CyaY-like superfamily)